MLNPSKKVKQVSHKMQNQSSKPGVKQIAAGIIFYGDKVLIGQRKRGKDNALLWEFPGGKQEKDETLEQCLQREFLEELNLKIQVGRFFMQSVYEYDCGCFAVNAFFATCDNPQINNIYEHEQIKWVYPEELPAYNFSAADVPIAQALISSLKSKLS